MAQLLMAHPDPIEKAYAWRLASSMVQAYIAAGDLQAAYTAAESTRDWKEAKIYESALSSIAISEARDGSLDKALGMLDSVRDDSRATLLAAIAERQAAAGNVAEARENLVLAVQAIAALDSAPARILVTTGAAKVMAHLGDAAGAEEKLREARAAADQVPQEVFRALSLGAIASTYADLGDLDAALSIARSIPRNSFRATALIHVVGAAAKQKKSIAADRLIEEALALVRADTYPVSRAASLGGVSAAFSFVGDQSRARQTMDEALAVAESAEKPLERAAALNGVAMAAAKSGDARRAVEIAETIDLAPERALALFGIAIGLTSRD